MLADVLRRASGVEAGIKVFTGSFHKQSAAGNQDISLSGHSGLPDLSSLEDGTWALMFSTTGAAASPATSGTWRADTTPGIGFVAKGGGSLSQYAFGAIMRDASGSSATARRMAVACIIQMYRSGATIWTDEATFSSFPTATSMRISWGTADSGAAWTAILPVINYTLITGLTGAKVVNWTTPTTSINKSVTGVGFSPDLVLHASSLVTILPSSAAEVHMSFGMMNKHGQQAFNSFTAADNAAAANTSRWQRTDSCFGYVVYNELPQTKEHFVSMDADGFTVNQSVSSGAAHYVASLCLDGISSKIGAFVEGSPLQTIASRQGFDPKGLLLSGVHRGPSASPGANAAWTVGMSDLVNSRAVALLDVDTADPTQADSVWHSGKIASSITNTTGPVDEEATLSSALENAFTIAWSAAPAGAELLYCLLGDADNDTFPTTAHDIYAYPAGIMATAYSNQKKQTQLVSGRQVIAYRDVSVGDPSHFFYWSDNNFQTKTLFVSGYFIAGADNISIDSYLDSGGTERLVAVWKQKGTGGGRIDGRRYYMVGTFNAGRTTITWGTPYDPNGLQASPENYLDVVCHAEGTGGRAHVVSSLNSASCSARYYLVEIDSSGVIGTVTHSVLGGGYGNTGDLFPSIDYDPVTKRLFVAWSAGTTGSGKGIRFRTASYSGGTWTWAVEVEVSTGHYAASENYIVQARWDAARNRIVIAGSPFTGALAKITAWVSTNFTSFGSPLYDVTLSGELRALGATVAIDPATGDIYTIGLGDVYALNMYVWRHVAATMDAVVILNYSQHAIQFYANALVLANGDIGFVYTHGASSPYSVKYDRIAL